MCQPQHFDVAPVKVVGKSRVEDPVQGPVGRGGYVEDPVRDQVARGPMGGDRVDAKKLQPEEVFTDPGPTIKRSTKVSKVPNKYKDIVKE